MYEERNASQEQSIPFGRDRQADGCIIIISPFQEKDDVGTPNNASATNYGTRI